MSGPALKWLFMKRLPAPQKSALLTLARRQPDSLGPVTDAAATLADESGLSLSGFKLAILGLRDKDLLRVEIRVNRPNRYHLNVESTTHEVTTHEVTTHEVTGEQSRGDTSTTHEVTTNKHKDKHTKTNTPSRKSEKAADPRFSEFVEELKVYWESANPGIEFEMDAKDGAAINSLLKRKALDRALFRKCLKNRLDSDSVTHAKSPYLWLSRVLEYASAPLDQYQKPKGTNHASTQGNTARQSTAERNRDVSRANILDAAAAVFGESFSGFDGRGPGVLQSPVDHDGNGGCLAGPVGSADGDIRSRGVHGRTIEGRL